MEVRRQHIAALTLNYFIVIKSQHWRKFWRRRNVEICMKTNRWEQQHEENERHDRESVSKEMKEATREFDSRKFDFITKLSNAVQLEY